MLYACKTFSSLEGNMNKRVAVLVSGGGTNLKALIDARSNGIIKSAKIVLVISNNKNAYALERAKNADILNMVIPNKEEDRLIEVLKEQKIDIIVLAGYLAILSERFTNTFAGKVINVHPSLIPSFCGKGYYGLKVHEKALEYGVKVTGATVHFVNEIPDGGKIILQKAVEVKEDDTPESLQKRVMEEAEWIILPKAVEMIAKENL
jgi:phosphoribosylglycinamide formyltransferase